MQQSPAAVQEQLEEQKRINSELQQRIQDLEHQQIQFHDSFGDLSATSVSEVFGTNAAESTAALSQTARPRSKSSHGVMSSIYCSSQSKLLVQRPSHSKAAFSSALPSTSDAGDEKAPFKLLKCSDERCEIVPASDGVVQTSHQSVIKVELNWDRPPRTVMVVKKPDDPEVRAKFLDATRHLASKGIRVLVEPSVKAEAEGLPFGVGTDGGSTSSPRRSSFADRTPPREPFPPDVRALLETWDPTTEQDTLHSKVDFIVCLGGDGTLLWASGLFPNTAVPPVVAFCELARARASSIPDQLPSCWR